MKVTVAGLWHLGCVTSACCARHFDVTGFDSDAQNVAKLNQGNAPLFEPGLDELIASGLQANRLRFSTDRAGACSNADLLWVTYDTPVNDQDESDIESVIGEVRQCVKHLRPGSTVLISSQLPVGCCRRLEEGFPEVAFAYSPENLQLGKAIAAFQYAERAIVGTRDGMKIQILEDLLLPFCRVILWMRTESAEMVKHGLNSFLALSITFINEIAGLCEKTGADAKEVSQGLKSDVRIGPKAYLSAGGPFAGGTLARDVVTLMRIAGEQGERLDVIPAIKSSNDWHRTWAFRRLAERLGGLKDRRIALLGLTYKVNTDTLRRSQAVELARSLNEAGAEVRAFDPAVKSLPESLDHLFELTSSVGAALYGSDAVVVCTEWPEFRDVQWEEVSAKLRGSLFLDPNRFLETQMARTNVEYLSVGRTA